MIRNKVACLLFAEEICLRVEVHPIKIVRIPFEARFARGLRDVIHAGQLRQVGLALAVPIQFARKRLNELRETLSILPGCS